MAGFKGGYGGGFGGGNMQNLMKQAQKMQQEMAKAQEELLEAEVVGSAAGGLVEVRVNGKNEFLGIAIKPEAVDPDDVEMLEDLISAAMNDAKEKADELSKEKMGAFGAMGGML
ncbi:MAG: YbaB/EbfC family nucleoid-associated protein [Bacillota bacterium]|nr:MAG: YbaB/EbfC family nucleoid-associated protein [Bacillota bacterium]